MKKIKAFLKKETVLCVSGILAAASCFIVPPSLAYLGYIDVRVLILLLCLMLVVAGIRQTGAFTVVCEALLKRIHGVRGVGLTLVLLSFFMSMLLTNDVTLVTLVPFTLLMFESISGDRKASALITLLVLETVSANLGSMLTPMGNPQNLYLYNKFEIPLGEFILITLPFSVLSLALLILCVFLFLPKMEIHSAQSGAKLEGRVRPILYAVLFAVCMLTILRILDERILLIIVVAAVLISDRRLFAKADYSLLITFVFFFIFVGNLGSLPALKEWLQKILEGREVLVSVILSQGISNVPAALLLSGLSDNARALIIGTNLGGLGTLIASMASLITYKLYAASKGSSPKRYILVFTAFNLGFLAVMAVVYLLMNR